MRQLKIGNRITNRGEGSLDSFLHEISKIPLLKPEEEVEFARRVREGNLPDTTEAKKRSAKEAMDRLIEANLRFVVSVAKQYQNQGLSLSDLINEGNLGLHRAVLRFDERKGFKFISYAVWWIRQSILQIISDQGRIVRYPPNKQALLNKINKAYAQLEQEFQRVPSLLEVAEYLDITEKEVEEALKNSGRHVSMDAPLVDGEEDSNMYKVLKSDKSPMPDKELIDESLKKDISMILGCLNEREAKVIKYFYGVDGCKSKTLEEIAEECNLTRERCRQLQTQGLKKLRQLSQDLLKDYLGGGD